jgi:hypothetical protein
LPKALFLTALLAFVNKLWKNRGDIVVNNRKSSVKGVKKESLKAY